MAQIPNNEGSHFTHLCISLDTKLRKQIHQYLILKVFWIFIIARMAMGWIWHVSKFESAKNISDPNQTRIQWHLCIQPESKN